MTFGAYAFTLRQLQYAVAVSETLSFRKAAALCHVSQPSLSAQLALMEDALGLPLFERDRQRVLITAAGAAMLERARQILREVDDLQQLARQSKDPLAGTLRIGVIPTMSPYLLPRISTAFRSQHPQLSVVWIEDKTETLVSHLAEGTLDAAVMALEAELGDLEHEVIGSDPFVLATPVGHPLGAKAFPAKPSELRDASTLLLDDGHCFRTQALAVCASAKAHELAFRATSLSTLVQMVADGAGVTLLPTMAVATETTRARICIRPFATPGPKRTVALVWRKRSPLAPSLRKLAATARSVYEPAGAVKKRTPRA